MNAVIYYTEIPEEYREKKMEHMIGEKLLETGLKKEYGRDLKFEPRSRGEHGKPLLQHKPFRKIRGVRVCRGGSGNRYPDPQRGKL